MQSELFDQVTVTWPEVVEWVARVAGITPDSPRFIPYVTAWSVADKVRAAKSQPWHDNLGDQRHQRHAE